MDHPQFQLFDVFISHDGAPHPLSHNIASQPVKVHGVYYSSDGAQLQSGPFFVGKALHLQQSKAFSPLTEMKTSLFVPNGIQTLTVHF